MTYEKKKNSLKYIIKYIFQYVILTFRNKKIKINIKSSYTFSKIARKKDRKEFETDTRFNTFVSFSLKNSRFLTRTSGALWPICPHPCYLSARFENNRE